MSSADPCGSRSLRQAGPLDHVHVDGVAGRQINHGISRQAFDRLSVDNRHAATGAVEQQVRDREISVWVQAAGVREPPTTGVAGTPCPAPGLALLSHFHASPLIADGLAPRTVADRLGHEDLAETLRTYAHLWPTDEDRAVAATEQALKDVV